MTRLLTRFGSVLKQGGATAAPDHPLRGIVAALCGVGLVMGVTGCVTPPQQEATPAANEQPSEPQSPATPAPPVITTTLVEPGDVILTTTVDELPIFSGPEEGQPEQQLSGWSDYGSPRTLMADTVHSIGEAVWYQVILPLKPHGQTGWVSGADVSVRSVDTSVTIDLDARTLTVFDGADEVFAATVAIGTDGTPTPVGTFYLTDPLDLTADDSGIYGAYALGLSGYSEVLDTFNGAPPQIAIHGTNQPWLLGQNVSNGCIRMSNEDVLRVAELVELGTPVTIA